MEKVKKRTPWRPIVTLDEILAYEHDKPETHTCSTLVNAVCDIMFQDDVKQPEFVAESLGLQRTKLTYAMEVLTGHSLADIRVEMMAKRWREYRAANPNCKEKDLGAAIGLTNYNSYWRFMERNRKHFPELQEEEENLRGHVMSELEKMMMKDESIAVRRLFGLLPYRGGKAEAVACARLLYTYGLQVWGVASEVLLRHPEIKFRRQAVRDVAMLHHVGIVWTDSPSLHCHGTEPYEKYSERGENWLNKHQQTTAGQCALSHHPKRICFLSNGFDELIFYASSFYSIFKPEHRKSVEEIRDTLAQYGDVAVRRFDELHQKFG